MRWADYDLFLQTTVAIAALVLTFTTSALHVLTTIVMPIKTPDSTLDRWGKWISIAALVLVLYCAPWAVDELFG